MRNRNKTLNMPFTILKRGLRRFAALAQAGYEPSYEEKRMACIVLGLRATVYPDNDMYPNKVDIEIAPPSVMKIVSPISQNS